MEGKGKEAVSSTCETEKRQIQCCTSSPRKVTQGVPPRSALSAPLFNLAMTVISGAISNIPVLAVRIVIYADDVALWCVGKSTWAQAIHAWLQESISAVSCMLKELGLSISLLKTLSLLYRR